ncbi:MAG: nucleotidyltransferase domain-containing protein [Pseudomonadota bacterium]
MPPDPSQDGHLALALSVVSALHPESEGALWAGSLARGEGTETSDLDLVILYPRLERAWRETLTESRLVETFVHDLDSLEVFFGKDRDRGVPVLASMVTEAIVLHDGPIVARAKAAAAENLAAGPAPWSPDEVDRSRYLLTDLRDDLRGDSDPRRIRALGATLYEVLLAHHRRCRGLWTAKSKAIPQFLRVEEPALAETYLTAFDQLFSSAEPAAVVALIDTILAPTGGPFRRWHAAAPPHR